MTGLHRAEGPAETGPAEADPRRPYKAIGSAVVAGALVAIAQGQDLLPPWVLLALAILVAGLSTYTIPNPPKPPS